MDRPDTGSRGLRTDVVSDEVTYRSLPGSPQPPAKQAPCRRAWLPSTDEPCSCSLHADGGQHTLFSLVVCVSVGRGPNDVCITRAETRAHRAPPPYRAAAGNVHRVGDRSPHPESKRSDTDTGCGGRKKKSRLSHRRPCLCGNSTKQPLPHSYVTAPLF